MFEYLINTLKSYDFNVFKNDLKNRENEFIFEVVNCDYEYMTGISLYFYDSNNKMLYRVVIRDDFMICLQYVDNDDIVDLYSCIVNVTAYDNIVTNIIFTINTWLCYFINTLQYTSFYDDIPFLFNVAFTDTHTRNNSFVYKYINDTMSKIYEFTIDNIDYKLYIHQYSIVLYKNNTIMMNKQINEYMCILTYIENLLNTI